MVRFVFREALGTGHNVCGFIDRLTAQNKGVIISQCLKDTVAIVFH